MTNILLVDDDKDTIRLVAMMLRRFGYIVELASNGEMAIRRLSSNKYNLLIIDEAMPDYYGHEIIDNLKLGQYGEINKSIPIIAFTARTSIATEFPNNDLYIANKPIHPRDLITLVEKAIIMK